MHPAVEDYRDNKADYDESYFIQFTLKQCQSNPQLARLCQRPEYQALVCLAKHERPFSRILSVLSQLSDDDLEWLVENMPSGWERSRIMAEEDAREVTLSERIRKDVLVAARTLGVK